jgi:DNA-binding NarL/FixJ family response regulator
MPIRIAIVDDQMLLREGFRKLLELEEGFVVVGTAANGEQALELLERLAQEDTLPTVMLMDIQMPRKDGIATTREIKAKYGGIQVVILTTFDDLELIRGGLVAGALGYLLKDVSAEQLVNTVREAAEGRVLLQPEIASKIFATLLPGNGSMVTETTTAGKEIPDNSVRTDQGEERPGQEQHQGKPLAQAYEEQLTEREREIIKLVARGASNRAIAERLFITEGTVKNHMTNILGKLGLRDRTQLALYARDHGIS